MDAIDSHSRSLTEDDNAESLIAARDLRFKVAGAAGEVNILRGLDLTVRRGEAVGLVGPSGSGKTSLLMLLAGLERPTGGALTVAGHDLGRLDEDALARFRRDNVGIVFQAFHLVPTMTALENVAIPLEFAGRRDAFDRAAAALEAVGLGHRTGHYPGQLSGGEQQRVALARATVAEPPLLLADEPTGNLDAATSEIVFRQLLGLVRETGMAALVATHNPELAARMDRTVTLRDGVLQG